MLYFLLGFAAGLLVGALYAPVTTWIGRKYAELRAKAGK